MNKNLTASFLLLSALCACAAQTPQLDYTSRNVSSESPALNARLASVKVSVAPPNQRSGDIQFGFNDDVSAENFQQAFESALRESFAKSALFGNSGKKYALTATVMKLHTPELDMDYDTDLIVRYQLLDVASGRVVFAKEIETTSHAASEYEFLGSPRYTQAHNRAVRKNIKQLIFALNQSQNQG